MLRKIQLSIPEPCHEDWNAMTPVASGRFCGSCSKEVIDFSGMSDAQLIQFFKEPRGSVCGRFRQQQLSAELVIPKKWIPWLRYFFTISLPAFLYSCKQNVVTGVPVVQTQKTIELMGDTIMVEPINESNMEITSTGLIEPLIVESKGEVVVNEEKIITNPRSHKVTQLTNCPPEIKEDTIITKTLEEVVVNSYEPYITGRYTVGGVSSYVVRTGLVDTIKAAIKNISDTIRPAIKLYPNPLTNGLPLKIDWNGCKPGVYHMQLVNMLGQILYTEKLTVNAKADLLTVNLPANKPGAYVLTFQSNNAFVTYSQKLIIR